MIRQQAAESIQRFNCTFVLPKMVGRFEAWGCVSDGRGVVYEFLAVCWSSV